jgi:hypothetical protein
MSAAAGWLTSKKEQREWYGGRFCVWKEDMFCVSLRIPIPNRAVISERWQQGQD